MEYFHWVASGDSPGVIAWIALGALLLWILMAEPLLGRRGHRAFLRDVATDPTARVRFYRQWTWMLFALGLVTVLVFALMPGLSLERLGLRIPDVGTFDAGPLGVMGGILAGSFIGVAVMARKSAKAPIAGGENVLAMLPRTGKDRIAFAWLCLAAGTMEEIVWRGMVVYVMAVIWPGAGLYAVAGVTALVFGIAHLYQGLAGVMATALIGAVLCWLYLYTGSLLVPMLVHVIVDLRAMLLPVKAIPSGADGAAA